MSVEWLSQKIMHHPFVGQGEAAKSSGLTWKEQEERDIILKARKCKNCKWFHKGIEVSHNHCDFQGRYDHYWDARERRVNGRETGYCSSFNKK